MLQAAFRDVHGPRLHGFALLLTLGNRSLAATSAARTLGEGARCANELRHPERAAAWLRRRLLRSLPRDPGRLTRESEAERRAALRALGVTDEVFDALATLRTDARAVLVLTAIERFAERDVESILDRRGAGLRRLLLQARSTYLGSVIAQHPGPPPPTLPQSISARIDEEASRTLGAAVHRT
jgi:hypothetical protein